MLKVLIIDDEPIVRQGLKKIIPWTENGFEVCGEGRDYDDGIEKIKELNPDIVLTDIKMPGHLGIELIEETIKHGFKGKFIIISGYSDFEYAKAGIKFGVKSYILKPIDEDELLNALIDIKNELINEKGLKQLELEKYILTHDGKLDKRYFNYDIFQISLFYCSIIDEDEEKRNKIESIIREKLISYDDIEILKVEGIPAVLFKGFNNKRMMDTIKNLYIKMCEEIEDDIFIAVGMPVDCCDNLINSYKSAKALLKQKFLYLDKGILYEEILNRGTSTENSKLDVSRIFSYTEVNDLEKLDYEFEKMQEYILEMKYSEEQIKIMCIKIFLEFKEKLEKDYDVSNLNLIKNEDIMKDIHSMKSLKNTIVYLKDKFKLISNKIGAVSSSSIIKRVINYMEKNYYKDLKLETLAGIFNYNSAYLGKLFKSVVGENFNTYLDKIRIERAKALLIEEKLKVYQVCEKVGYKNIDYFHSKFKKYVGMSPLNYKKQNESKEEVF